MVRCTHEQKKSLVEAILRIWALDSYSYFIISSSLCSPIEQVHIMTCSYTTKSFLFTLAFEKMYSVMLYLPQKRPSLQV